MTIETEVQDDPQKFIADAQRSMRSAAKVRSVRERSNRFRRSSGIRAAAHAGILIVEDDALMQSSLFRTFQGFLGLDFAIANSLGAARRALGYDTPWDIVAVDLNLREDDGAEFIHEVILSGVCSIPVVLTGLSVPIARERLGEDADKVIIREKSDDGVADWLVNLARDARAKSLAR